MMDKYVKKLNILDPHFGKFKGRPKKKKKKKGKKR